MNILVIFIVMISLLTYPMEGKAMSPYRPEVLEFHSKDKRHALFIPKPPKTPTLEWAGKLHTWPKIQNPHPNRVLFNEPREQIILIGGLGDPGVNLGDLFIHSLSGDLVGYVELKKEFPELESMSRQWSKRGNFPWVAGVRLAANGTHLRIWICRKLIASVDLGSFAVSIEASTDPEEWSGGIDAG